MKKKILTTLFIMALCIFTLGIVSASAETYLGFTYKVENGEATITRCDSWVSGEVVIPDTLGGCPVTSIGAYAFYDCGNISSISMPDSVTSIGYGAFYGCRSLSSINIPDRVTSIGAYAFYYCDSLSNINLNSIKNIPDSVTSIGAYAFYSCDSLSSINIPDSVTSIGEDAFWGCRLESVYITDIAAWCKIEFEDYDSNPSSCAKNLYLNGILVTDLVIPDGVTSIGAYAFYGCDSLSSINIPDSVTSIGSRAFEGCDSLSSINIPDSVTSIGSRAFYYCDSLSSINIPDSVTSIGAYAFGYCSMLESVYITDIAAWCRIEFANSYSNPLWDVKNLYLNGILVTDLVIPDGVTRIGAYAFSYYDSLSSISIPNSVTSIGEGAFYECSSLSSVSIPDSVTSIGSSAFYNCSSLSSINIPDSVSFISYYAFYECSSLSSINIPDSVSYIGLSAFYNCRSLKSVYIDDIEAWCKIGFADSYSNPLGYAKNLYLNGSLVTDLEIPDGVKSIRDNAFYNCRSLSSINIPDSVTSIGDNAFYNCRSLSSINIPDSVTSIGDNAFYWCSLKSVYITDIEAWCKIEFADSYSNPLNQGASLYGAGINGGKLVIPEGVKVIKQYAFYNCNNITSVTVSSGVEGIFKYAFAKSSISEIIIPPSTIQIASTAFDSYPDVYGVLGSPAEQFAKSKGYTFKSLDDVVYTISYDAAGGTGAPQSQSKGYDTNLTLSNSSPEKKHCKFLGWALSKGGAAEYKPGDVFKINADTTLYAVWAEPAINVKEKLTCAISQNVSVVISLENNPGMAGLKLEIDYPESFELVSVSKADALNSLELTTLGDMSSNPFVLLWDGEKADSSNGDIVVFTYRVKDTAQIGNYDICVNIAEAYDGSEENISFENKVIAVEVKDYIPGDINGDGYVTTRDVTALRRHTAGGYHDNVVVEATLDVNRDGEFSGKDVTHLRRFIAGGYGIELR